MGSQMSAQRVAVLVGLWVACGLAATQPSRCVADDAPSLPKTEVKAEDFARNILKLRFTSLLIANGVGAGYEYALTDWFTVGASFGIGHIASFSFFSSNANLLTTGGDLTFSFMTQGDYKFSGGLGVSFNYLHEKPLSYENVQADVNTEHAERDPGLWFLLPVLNLAYRYQPAAGGIFWESGLGIHAGLNLGVEINIGYVF